MFLNIRAYIPHCVLDECEIKLTEKIKANPELTRLVDAARLERIVTDASLTISCSEMELVDDDVVLLVTIMIVQWPFRYGGVKPK